MRRAGRRRAATAATLACLVVVGAAGCGQAGQFSDDDPRTAVNELLLAAVGQANGQRACSLMSAAARARMDEGPAGSCRQALSNAVSSLPGVFDATNDAGRGATDLDFTVRHEGDDRATVTARRGNGPAWTFRVIRLSASEAEQDQVGRAEDRPATPWRVDRGAEQLLEVDPSRPGPQTTTAPAPAPDGTPAH